MFGEMILAAILEAIRILKGVTRDQVDESDCDEQRADCGRRDRW